MNENHNKKWNETKTNDSWSIFKIMGEFVEGYEKLSAIGPCMLPIDKDVSPLYSGVLYGVDTRATEEINYLNR